MFVVHGIFTEGSGYANFMPNSRVLVSYYIVCVAWRLEGIYYIIYIIFPRSSGGGSWPPQISRHHGCPLSWVCVGRTPKTPKILNYGNFTALGGGTWYRGTEGATPLPQQCSAWGSRSQRQFWHRSCPSGENSLDQEIGAFIGCVGILASKFVTSELSSEVLDSWGSCQFGQWTNTCIEGRQRRTWEGHQRSEGAWDISAFTHLYRRMSEKRPGLERDVRGVKGSWDISAFTHLYRRMSEKDLRGTSEEWRGLRHLWLLHTCIEGHQRRTWEGLQRSEGAWDISAFTHLYRRTVKTCQFGQWTNICIKGCQRRTWEGRQRSEGAWDILAFTHLYQRTSEKDLRL